MIRISTSIYCALITFVTNAAIINVTDYGDGTASKANFDSAYAASSAGDTIAFPAGGSASWSASATIDKPLVITGNGTALTAGATLNNGFFYVTGFQSDDLVRITGFVFTMASELGVAIKVLNGGVELGKLRIDNNEFHFGYESLHVGGSIGVIDSNTFYNALKGISFTAGSAEQAASSWNDLTMGTANALFIEDNNFIDDENYEATYSQERIGTYNGGKLVIRYNHFESSDYPNATTIYPIMTHGSAAGGVAYGYWQIGTEARRGQSTVEIYGNVMEGKRIDFLATLRGSANLVFNNTLQNTVTAVPRIYLREEEWEDEQWDPLRTAWPAEDQVHNTFIWGNTIQGSALSDSNFVVGGGDYIQLGRDYWTNAPAATGGYEYFTGANGASSSYPTDGDTHPTLGTMVFEADGPNAYYGYVPYRYPHPLRGTTRRLTAQTINAGIVRGE